MSSVSPTRSNRNTPQPPQRRVSIRELCANLAPPRAENQVATSHLPPSQTSRNDVSEDVNRCIQYNEAVGLAPHGRMAEIRRGLDTATIRHRFLGINPPGFTFPSTEAALRALHQQTESEIENGDRYWQESLDRNIAVRMERDLRREEREIEGIGREADDEEAWMMAQERMICALEEAEKGHGYAAAGDGDGSALDVSADGAPVAEVTDGEEASGPATVAEGPATSNTESAVSQGTIPLAEGERADEGSRPRASSSGIVRAVEPPERGVGDGNETAQSVESGDEIRLEPGLISSNNDHFGSELREDASNEIGATQGGPKRRLSRDEQGDNKKSRTEEETVNSSSNTANSSVVTAANIGSSNGTVSDVEGRHQTMLEDEGFVLVSSTIRAHQNPIEVVDEDEDDQADDFVLVNDPNTSDAPATISVTTVGPSNEQNDNDDLEDLYE